MEASHTPVGNTKAWNVVSSLPPLVLLQAFADRFEEPDDAELEYEQTSYAIRTRIEDTIGAGTAPPPEHESPRGCFWGDESTDADSMSASPAVRIG